MLLDYLEHQDYLVYLDLFYESTSSIVHLTIADNYHLAIDNAFADVGVASCDVLNSTNYSSLVVKCHRHVV